MTDGRHRGLIARLFAGIYRLFVSIFFRSQLMILLSFVLIAVIVIVSGALLLHAMHNVARDVGNFSFADDLWLATGSFFDPGTAAGIDPTAHHLVQMVIIFCVMLFGFAWMGMVFGLIIDAVTQWMRRWRKRHDMVVASGHIVVLGWNDKTLFMLGELAQMLTGSPQGGGLLVVLYAQGRHKPLL